MESARHDARAGVRSAAAAREECDESRRGDDRHEEAVPSSAAASATARLLDQRFEWVDLRARLDFARRSGLGRRADGHVRISIKVELL
jgi:hypothetical protein